MKLTTICLQVGLKKIEIGLVLNKHDKQQTAREILVFMISLYGRIHHIIVYFCVTGVQQT
jgi:hypothetical protein